MIRAAKMGVGFLKGSPREIAVPVAVAVAVIVVYLALREP